MSKISGGLVHDAETHILSKIRRSFDAAILAGDLTDLWCEVYRQHGEWRVELHAYAAPDLPVEAVLRDLAMAHYGSNNMVQTWLSADNVARRVTVAPQPDHVAAAVAAEEADRAAVCAAALAMTECAHRTTRDCECCGGWEQRCLDCGEHVA